MDIVCNSIESNKLVSTLLQSSVNTNRIKLTDPKLEFIYHGKNRSITTRKETNFKFLDPDSLNILCFGFIFRILSQNSIEDVNNDMAIHDSIPKDIVNIIARYITKYHFSVFIQPGNTNMDPELPITSQELPKDAAIATKDKNIKSKESAQANYSTVFITPSINDIMSSIEKFNLSKLTTGNYNNSINAVNGLNCIINTIKLKINLRIYKQNNKEKYYRFGRVLQCGIIGIPNGNENGNNININISDTKNDNNDNNGNNDNDYSCDDKFRMFDKRDAYAGPFKGDKFNCLLTVNSQFSKLILFYDTMMTKYYDVYKHKQSIFNRYKFSVKKNDFEKKIWESSTRGQIQKAIKQEFIWTPKQTVEIFVQTQRLHQKKSNVNDELENKEEHEQGVNTFVYFEKVVKIKDRKKKSTEIKNSNILAKCYPLMEKNGDTNNVTSDGKVKLDLQNFTYFFAFSVLTVDHKNSQCSFRVSLDV